MSATKERTSKRQKPPSNSPESQKLKESLASLNSGDQSTCSAGSGGDGGGKLRKRLDYHYGDDNNSSSSGESSEEEECLFKLLYDGDVVKNIGGQQKYLGYLTNECLCYFAFGGQKFHVVNVEEDKLLEVKLLEDATCSADVIEMKREGMVVEVIGEGARDIINIPCANILDFHSCCEVGWRMRHDGEWGDDDFVGCETCPNVFCLHSVGGDGGCFCNVCEEFTFARLSSKKRMTTQVLFQCRGCTASYSVFNATAVEGLNMTKITAKQFMDEAGLQPVHRDDDPRNVSFEEVELDGDDDRSQIAKDNAESSTVNVRAKKKNNGALLEHYLAEAADNMALWGDDHPENGSDKGGGEDEGGEEESVHRTVPNIDDISRAFSRKFTVGSVVYKKQQKLQCLLNIVTCILKKSNRVDDKCLDGWVDSAYWDAGRKSLTVIAHYLKEKKNKKKKEQKTKGAKAKKVVGGKMDYTEFGQVNVDDISTAAMQLARMFHTQHCEQLECELCDSSLPEQKKDTALKKTTPACVMRFIEVFDVVYDKAHNELAAGQAKRDKKKKKDRELAKGAHIANFCYQEEMVSEMLNHCVVLDCICIQPNTRNCLLSALSLT